MAEGLRQGRVIAGVILTGTSGKDYHGVLTDMSKGEPGFVLQCHSQCLEEQGCIRPSRTAVNVPLLGYYKMQHCWLTVRVLTHLGLRVSTPGKGRPDAPHSEG